MLQGQNGIGNQFADRFASGDVISASQLNDLINGISTALPQPFIGDGVNVSFGSGGTQITTNTDADYLSIIASLNINLASYVNHWQVKVVGADVGSGTLGFWLKVAKGGNVWRPAYSDCDLEHRVDEITTDGSTVLVVDGTDAASPWMNSDGYIVLSSSTPLYVYAFKVETASATNFYCYVSLDGTLADSCPVSIPAGIPTPSGAHDVQCLKVADVTWTAGVPLLAVVSQHVVGSITWPNPAGGAVAAEPEQFAIEIDQAASTFRMRKGNVISVVGGQQVAPFMSNFDTNFAVKQFQIVDFGIYKTGSRVVGTDPESPYLANGGHMNLVNFEEGGSDAYRVCIVLNRNKIVGDNPGSDLFVYVPYLAFFAIGGDGDLKTQPFKMTTIGGINTPSDSQEYYDGFMVDQYSLNVIGPPPWYEPLNVTIFPWSGDSEVRAPKLGFKNYNAQKVIVADILWNATTSKWDIHYGSKGPITIPNNMTYAGPVVANSSNGGTLPIWFSVPENEGEQIAWESDYSDCTKWTIASGAAPSVLI